MHGFSNGESPERGEDGEFTNAERNMRGSDKGARRLHDSVNDGGARARRLRARSEGKFLLQGGIGKWRRLEQYL